MVITKDLGAVSAYAYAVEQGYQGTEEEFAELMARQATVAEEAAASADAAAESASEAQASAEQAEQSAQSISGDVERAEQAATTATGKATEAATSATTANGAAQTATGKAAQAEQSATAAANSASAAATSASNAASSATAAQTAQTAAETAQGKAEDAQAAAEAAAQSVSESATQIAKNTDNFASAFSASTTYAIGDYCIHEGNLYRFINEHTGAWSASDVEATNVGGEIGDVKSAIMPVEDLKKYAIGGCASYINSGHAISNSGNWNMYIFRRNDIYKITKIVSSVAATFNIFQLAFYSDIPISEDTFISGIKFTTANTQKVLENIIIPENAQLITVCGRATEDIIIEGSIAPNREEPLYSKYENKLILIGYSNVINPNNYVINTAEMYNYVGSQIYDGIKGDVRITSDNQLVMCHDAGFTLNSDGEIISFDSNNYTPIRNMTLAQIEELVFAQRTSDNTDMKVPTFDEFASICKKYGKICFATLRDENVETILPLVFSTLDKYNIRDNTIINSLSYDTIIATRKADKRITACYTVNYRNISIGIGYLELAKAAQIGNCIFGFYAVNGGTASELESKLSTSQTMIELFHDFNIPIYCAITRKSQLPLVLKYNLAGTQSYDTW